MSGLRDGRSGFLVPARKREISVLQNVPTLSGAHPASYASRRMFLGVNRPGLEADHSPPFSSEVKTMELHFHSPYTPSRRVQTQFYF
jgi:hypothetical protein